VSEPRALTKNASDPEQVARAGRKVKTRRDAELRDLQSLLATPAGERFFWRALKKGHVLETVFDESRARMYLKVGEQNFALWLLAEIQQADDAALARLMQRSRRTEQQEDVENEAIQTPSALTE
jgi:hypothetical protein